MISVLLLTSLAHGAQGDPMTFQVDGQTRTAIVFKPSSPKEKKPAAYFVFHGLGGNAKAAVRQFHIHELDPTAYVVYAEGLPANAQAKDRRIGARMVRVTGKNTWQIMPGQYEDRDIHFVQALLKWADKAGVDPSHRYYVGHSNGSVFGWVALKEIGDQFTRFVGMNGGTLLPLAGSAKKPVFLTTGTQDKLISAASVKTFAEKLANYNGCSDGSGSPIKTYTGMNPVYVYEYDGGHMPPADAYQMAVRFCQTGKPN